MTGITKDRSFSTSSKVFSAKALTNFSSCAPRLSTAICGPSMCKPRSPDVSLTSIAASTALAKVSGASVISVGIIAEIPKQRWFRRISSITFADGFSFNKKPPPPLTCRSTNPGETTQDNGKAVLFLLMSCSSTI